MVPGLTSVGASFTGMMRKLCTTKTWNRYGFYVLGYGFYVLGYGFYVLARYGFYVLAQGRYGFYVLARYGFYVLAASGC